MNESVFQTFQLLATFSAALIAVSIANFAVSASFLGRETRLTRSRMEKRKRKLSSKLKELQEKDKHAQISDLENEIKKAKKDISNLNIRILLLSWLGAVIIPTVFFGVSLILAMLGMNVDFLEPNLQSQGIWIRGFLAASSFFITLGFLFLMVVIRMIDSTARNPPLPMLEASFPNYETIIKVKRNKETTVTIEVSNYGEAIAEDTTIYVDFPPAFEVLHIPRGIHSIETMTEKDMYPEYTCVRIIMGDIPINSVNVIRIIVRAPDEKKTFKIPVSLREKTVIGSLDFEFTVEVED